MTNKHQTKPEDLCELLPWYVSRTLNEAELNAMDQHLHHCQECADELPILQAVQNAVHNESISALAPKPNTEQFLANARRRSLLPFAIEPAWVAIAACMALIAVALIWTQSKQSMTMPTIYQTATSTAGDATFDYVVLISFEQQTDPDGRETALRALAPVSAAGPDSNGNYRIVIRLPARSMGELEAIMQDIESNSAISSAAVVAVELPVESR